MICCLLFECAATVGKIKNILQNPKEYGIMDKSTRIPKIRQRQVNVLGKTAKNKKKRQERVRLDETVKLLFEVSKELLVKTMNALFDEEFDPERVEVDKTATEYPTKDLDIIRADLFIKITEDRPNHFHIEIETEPNDKIGLRAFEYDVMKAISNWRLESKTEGIPVLHMPKTLVIHIEGGGVVPQESHGVDLVFADGAKVRYSARVMRYWEYDEKKLIEAKLYTLLPLRIFMLRDELDRTTAQGDETARQAAILKARDETANIAKEVIDLYREEEISLYDVDKIMIAASELFQHLNKRYNVNEKLNEEVSEMVRTFIDPKVERRGERRGKKEVATKMLLKNKPIEEIIEFTGLTEKEIEKIRKTL